MLESFDPAASLRLAIQADDARACANALERGADERLAHDGYDPLLEALRAGAKACVGVLAPWRDLGEVGADGLVFFERALKLGPDRASWLLEALDPRRAGSDSWCRGWTPLMVACAHRLDLCAAKLLPRSNPDALCPETGQDALMMAAKSGALAALQLLVPASNPARADRFGMDALRWALASGNIECAQELAPFSTVDALDREPLAHAAILSDDPACVELAALLAPQSFLRASRGRTALDAALLDGVSGSTAQAVALASDPHGVDSLGRPILWAATVADCDLAVSALIARGANPDARGPDGATCAMWAARHGRLGALKVLAPLANLDLLDPDGRPWSAWGKKHGTHPGSVAAQSMINAQRRRTDEAAALLSCSTGADPAGPAPRL
jgi:ankyrin repeat protein